ncbi:thioredoxin domain-containing protein [Natranaeroarchaeum aerophilus]|uniref:Thioredoxin domain-containing protein n=1 Tax=Natranaeroarchaeum aerophilus TaxID=2917711 RepID=A0AAE3FQG9_9EURY|nr:thioredoxin domain-containing protein [Natranaeroarchaeum aerophilus]MCL9813443.1 thioredoxin domain-containing protein [Natranaeroarchaeum aerophilus]
MTDPTRRNRLDEEQSPYLRQHADNPVNWQPWDEEALAAAEERDQPIFLSVGYSACHWCHVMEAESFEDETVAEKLNENFVPIKVDREERPDLDSVYQTVCQLVSGRGGWPLSVWLTPEGKPFYVGTYFPRESRQGMPGFLDLLDNIANSWEDSRGEMESRAEEWTKAAKGQLEETPSQPAEVGDSVLADAANTALRAADRDHGGFGPDGPKFPQPTRIHLLMRAYERTGRETFREAAIETLDAMADRGLYDHVGGGFHRYATDREWIVPHFEKMLYDNAEIPRAYLAGYQLTGDDRYARVVEETFEFVERELTHAEGVGEHEHGGFYSTLDAQSDGEEGKFYVWTPRQIEEILDDDADLFCDRYGITRSGNFEGKTVLTLARSVESLAEEYDLGESSVERRLADAREQVFAAREERIRPGRDEKILASWNGLLISALAEGGLVLDERWTDLAEDALAFVRDQLWNADTGELARRYKPTEDGGDIKGEGYLEDYAFLARGAFDCYQATGDVDHLAFALDLARTIEAEFWDESAKTIYYTPESGESLVTRPQERRDQSTPSSLGVAVDVLLSLDPFVDHDRFDEIAGTVLSTQGQHIESSPLEHTTLALAADRRRTGDLELTVAADSLPDEWCERLAETYQPNRILARRPPTADGLAEWLDTLELDEAPPIWHDRTAESGAPTIYTCRSFTCSPPVTTIEEALEWAEDLAPDAR